jgi:DNA (cytosine-5)-methyltransferase 1
VVAFDSTQITSRANRSNPQAGDPCHPLAAEAHAPAIAFHPTQDPIHSSDGTTHALGCGSAGWSASVAVATGITVRRLTPRECERLQGFPDDYTAIPWRKKFETDCPDGPRYKALGNSWAVPVVRWIGQRIADANNPQSTPTVGATA